MKDPRLLLAFGLIMMCLGIALPFLMVIKILESTFFMNFFAWGLSSLGLALGMVGFALSRWRAK